MLLTKKPREAHSFIIKLMMLRRLTFLYSYAVPLLKKTAAVPLSASTLIARAQSEERLKTVLVKGIFD